MCRAFSTAECFALKFGEVLFAGKAMCELFFSFFCKLNFYTVLFFMDEALQRDCWWHCSAFLFMPDFYFTGYICTLCFVCSTSGLLLTSSGHCIHLLHNVGVGNCIHLSHGVSVSDLICLSRSVSDRIWVSNIVGVSDHIRLLHNVSVSDCIWVSHIVRVGDRIRLSHNVHVSDHIRLSVSLTLCSVGISG